MFAISTTILCFMLFGTPSVATNGISDDYMEGVPQDIEKTESKRQLKIGMFQPLICEGFYRHNKDRRARDVGAGGTHSKLGFFTPVYCKHMGQWLNNRKWSRCQKRKSDCYEILQCTKKYGRKARNGVYWIKPKHYKPIQVYCDMRTDGGGWTVFQHRMDGSVNFFRTWSEYKNGFGKLNKEFWLGNDNIHAIVSQGQYSLRLNLEDYDGNKRYAFYKNFKIGNEKQKYKLRIAGYSGNAGDSLTSHTNHYFSTKDRDNDTDSRNCAVRYTGAWWYINGGYNSNLNGLYYNQKKKKQDFKYNIWGRWPGKMTNMKTSQLAVRWLRKLKN